LDNGLGGPRIALLIDFDNVILGVDDPGFDVELVVNALRERGTIVMGRAYGDWYRHNKHRRKLMEHGVELVETPAFGPVIKNSADIRIALDGYEIGMTQHHIDTFCLVSGDSDFLPLIKKLQYLGKKVLVISGTKFTSDMLRRNCNEFVSYENLLAQSVGATEDATTLDGAFALLHRAIAALRERGSEVRSSTVKQMMLQLNPVFSEKTFNCNQFRGFLDKAVDARVIKLGGRDRASGEITVLLPEDEEKIEERREVPEVREAAPEPEVRPDRRRRAEMRAERAAQLATAVDSIDAVLDLATTTPEDRQLDVAETKSPEPNRPLRGPRRGGREAAPVAEDREVFAPAAPEDAASRATTASALLNRGMRRGRLRFAAGRLMASPPEPTPAPAAESAPEPAPEADALAGTLDVPVTQETWPEFAQPETVADAVTEGLFAVPSEEQPVAEEAPAEAAVTEGLAVEAEAAAPKTRSRRRRTTKKAETPAEGEAPVEAAPAPEASASEEAPAEAAPKKPARRRRTTKKADTPPPAEG
jgi:uncharacterized protein (TIGR00288 family)